MYISLAQQDQ